jgi:hypothetical protein
MHVWWLQVAAESRLRAERLLTRVGCGAEGRVLSKGEEDRACVQLRREVVLEMQKQREVLSLFVTEDWSLYVGRMALAGTWGGAHAACMHARDMHAQSCMAGSSQRRGHGAHEHACGCTGPRSSLSMHADARTRAPARLHGAHSSRQQHRGTDHTTLARTAGRGECM